MKLANLRKIGYLTENKYFPLDDGQSRNSQKQGNVALHDVDNIDDELPKLLDKANRERQKVSVGGEETFLSDFISFVFRCLHRNSMTCY